jgi:predicted dehydrogenase
MAKKAVPTKFDAIILYASLGKMKEKRQSAILWAFNINLRKGYEMTVAIIGTGWGTRIQVPAFHSAGLNVVALAGRDRAKTESAAAKLGIPQAFDDWRAVLAHEDVQVVSIVTPPDSHHEMSIAALEAGKHVLCEKPTALNAAEAQDMLEAAAKYPNQFSIIDHELRFLPTFLHARQLIAEGKIGTVRSATSIIYSASRSDPNRVWNWWSDAGQGGGLLGAVGSHQIDRLRFVLQAEVATVSAALRNVFKERPTTEGVKPVTSDDYYSLRLRFNNEVWATLEASATVHVDEPDTMTIYGSAGTLRWQEDRLYLAAGGKSYEEITPEHRYPLPQGLSGAFPHGTVYIGHAIRQYLEGDQTALSPAATFEDGLHIQRIMDAARQSNQEEGRNIRLG